jgi:threonine/homoserine/homoserine lactone efflux protein
VNLAKLLSLSFVMIAGPQILTAIFLATSEKWRQTSAALVAGAAVSVTAVVTIGFLIGTGATDNGASSNGLSIVILLLLLAAAVHTFVTRKQSKPPKWMGELEAAKPKQAFKLGFLLLGLFPSDILTSLAVGGYVVSHDEAWWNVLPFVAMTLFLLAIPALVVWAFGERAQVVLPKVRDWMSANSWVVSEVVLALFIALTVSSL